MSRFIVSTQVLMDYLFYPFIYGALIGFVAVLCLVFTPQGFSVLVSCIFDQTQEVQALVTSYFTKSASLFGFGSVALKIIMHIFKA